VPGATSGVDDRRPIAGQRRQGMRADGCSARPLAAMTGAAQIRP
jgi:hypothetical protein